MKLNKHKSKRKYKTRANLSEDYKRLRKIEKRGHLVGKIRGWWFIKGISNKTSKAGHTLYECQCIGCGTTQDVSPYAISNSGSNGCAPCSRKRKTSYIMSRPVEISCGLCGVFFETTPNLLKNGRRFCTTACMVESGFSKSQQSGPNNSNWRGGTSDRSKPKKRLNKRMSDSVRQSLKTAKNGKNGRHWEPLVGYDTETLHAHLEKQFLPGMSWENFGDWHIDHKIPISVFNFTSTEDIDFKRCWGLDNLQPLWAKDNIMKRDKLNKPFQPSLAFGGAI